HIKLLLLHQDLNLNTNTSLSSPEIESRLDNIHLDVRDLESLLTACRNYASGAANLVMDASVGDGTLPVWERDSPGICEGTREFEDLSGRLGEVGEEEMFEGVPDAETEKKVCTEVECG
ncbi:hypothetical protein HDU98_005793, partial [Podochytrium sp. JEL0797]